MKVALVMLRPDGGKRAFPLNRDITVVGRREDCDLRIPLGDISRKHCRVVKDYDVVRLEDLGSSNGTYCNGVRIQETALEAGDVMVVGPVTFVVQIDGHPAVGDIQAPQASGSGETAIPSGALPVATAAGDGGDMLAGDDDADADDFVSVDDDDDDALADGDNARLADDDAPAPPDIGAAASADEVDAEIIEDAFVDDDAPPPAVGGPRRIVEATKFDLVDDPSGAPKRAGSADADDGIDLKIDLEEDSKR